MANPSFFVETRWGGSEDAPTPKRLAEIVQELDTQDEEHPDTWLTHGATGWTLRLDEDGFAYLEDGYMATVRHMQGISRETGLDLWLRFAEKGPDGVALDSWRDGPRVRTAEEWAHIHDRAAQITLESDRQFFNLLGSEDLSQPCKRTGCGRGRIQYSALCKVHQFEQIRNKPCPFQ